MRSALRGLCAGALLLAALAGLGCTPVIGGPTPPSRFYLLRALEAPPERTDGPGIGVGPVRLAGYLDRPQIVRRRGSYALQLAEFDRWAEPLGESITRVVMANLAAALGTDRVQRHPWRDSRAVDLEVQLDVLRFDGPPEGPVELEVLWRLRTPAGTRLNISRLREPLEGSGYEAQADAMSRALQRLCREIAGAAAGDWRAGP